jgi:hypothetical protein
MTKKAKKPAKPAPESKPPWKEDLPSPEKIVAALKYACEKRNVEWPLPYPSGYNVSDDARDDAFVMEVRSAIATQLGIEGLKFFIGKAVGKVPANADYTLLMRAGFDLVHHAFGHAGNDDSEWESFPDREQVLTLFEVKEKAMTKSKTKTAAAEEPKVRKNAKAASTPEPEEAAPPKTKRGKKEAPALTERDLGYVLASIDTVNDISHALEEKFGKDPRVAAVIESLDAAIEAASALQE